MTAADAKTVAECAAQAVAFLEQSDADFKAGDRGLGSGKLYDAARQAVIAVAKQRGWEYDSHRAVKEVTYRLAAEYDDLFWIGGFIGAEKFYENFFYGQDEMEDYEIVADRPVVHLFVNRMVALVGESTPETPARSAAEIKEPAPTAADAKSVAECTAQALAFLAQSDVEFDAGNRRQGSGKLYDAARQAVIAAAKQRGWEYDSHRALTNATSRLAAEYNDLYLVGGFAAAEKFHQNFIHGQDEMEDYEIAADRPAVHGYVNHMVALVNEYARNA